MEAGWLPVSRQITRNIRAKRNFYTWGITLTYVGYTLNSASQY